MTTDAFPKGELHVSKDYAPARSLTHTLACRRMTTDAFPYGELHVNGDNTQGGTISVGNVPSMGFTVYGIEPQNPKPDFYFPRFYFIHFAEVCPKNWQLGLPITICIIRITTTAPAGTTPKDCQARSCF